MFETIKNSRITTASEIKILGINREKTRRVNASDSNYQVYFELSEAPSAIWREVFDQEWKTLIPPEFVQSQQADIDGRFLVMHCALQDVANSFLPLLKEAVVASNTSYQTYVQIQAAEQDRQVDVWKEERQSVNAMADSLSFD